MEDIETKFLIMLSYKQIRTQLKESRMTAADVLDLARRTWSLPWEIDERAEPPVVSAECGALVVAIALTSPLTIIGTLAEEEFFEAETDNVPGALAELEQAFRRLVDVPGLAER